MRRDLEAMLALADRLDAAGERGVFATLVSTRGSSYRPLGSMMLAGPPGTPRAGGVSGGCLEEYIARHGRELLVHQPAALLGFDTSSDGDLATARPTLGCGGHVDVLIERFGAEHRTLLERLHRACVAGPADCIVTRIDIGGSTGPNDVNVRRVPSSEGGALRDQAIAARRTLATSWDRPPARATGTSGHLHALASAPTSPSAHFLAQYAEPQPRLLICGAGNDAQPLATLATMADWSVTVIDRRARLATRDRFPHVDGIHTIHDDWRSICSFVPADSYVVMLTHDLADDIAIATALADVPPAYVGVLGPAHRLDWVKDGLRSAGVPDAFIDVLRGPIGLDLGGRAPEQIALAIVAEITAHRFGRSGRPLSEPPADAVQSLETADDR